MNAQEEFNAFLEAQKNIEYTLGDITGTADGDMKKYTELKIAVSQEQEKLKVFNKEKEEAFAELRAEHDSELIALGQVWQKKEDEL